MGVLLALASASGAADWLATGLAEALLLGWSEEQPVENAASKAAAVTPKTIFFVVTMSFILPFIIFPDTNGMTHHAFTYPLTEPIITPFTKYF